jgi:hypothetical protein
MIQARADNCLCIIEMPCPFNPKPEAMVVCWHGRCALETAVASSFGLSEYRQTSEV